MFAKIIFFWFYIKFTPNENFGEEILVNTFTIFYQ